MNTQGLSLPDGLIIVDDIYSGDGRNDFTLWNDGSIKQCLDGLNLKRITDDQYLEPYRVLAFLHPFVIPSTLETSQ